MSGAVFTKIRHYVTLTVYKYLLKTADYNKLNFLGHPTDCLESLTAVYSLFSWNR